MFGAPPLPFLPRTKARIVLAVWLLVAFFATAPIVTAFVVTPEDIESGRVVLTPPCPYKRLTGRDCPSCGLTRAFAAIGHGRFTDAFHFHRGSLVVFGLASVVALLGWTKSLRQWRTSTA